LTIRDNAASLYRDTIGWTIHRKRAWTAILSGAHYDYIDFSVTVGSEAGTVDSQQALRTWMKHLSKFIHAFDFLHAKPLAHVPHCTNDSKPAFDDCPFESCETQRFDAAGAREAPADSTQASALAFQHWPADARRKGQGRHERSQDWAMFRSPDPS
jgi:hypothetical protein